MVFFIAVFVLDIKEYGHKNRDADRQSEYIYPIVFIPNNRSKRRFRKYLAHNYFQVIVYEFYVPFHSYRRLVIGFFLAAMTE